MATNKGRFQPGNTAALKHGLRRSSDRSSDRLQNGDATDGEPEREELLRLYPQLASDPHLLESACDCQRAMKDARKYLTKDITAKQRQDANKLLDQHTGRWFTIRDRIDRLATPAGILPPGVQPWQLGEFRLKMEFGDDPGALRKQRLELIAKGVPPELLPETQEAARRVGQARRVEFARIKAENPSLKPEDAAARVGLFGYKEALNV